MTHCQVQRQLLLNRSRQSSPRLLKKCHKCPRTHSQLTTPDEIYNFDEPEKVNEGGEVRDLGGADRSHIGCRVGRTGALMVY